MSAEKLPYLQITTDLGVTLLHVPVIEKDPAAEAIFKKIGLRRLVGMAIDGSTIDKDGNSSIAWEIVAQTPYTIALYNIGLEEKANQVPEGSYKEALSLMLADAFDDSSWAPRYLPRQTD